LTKITNYEALHYKVFPPSYYSLFSYDQIFSLTLCTQTPSIYVLLWGCFMHR